MTRLGAISNPKGLAIVHDREDFENLIEDLYLTYQGYDPFLTDEEWCEVFCDPEKYPLFLAQCPNTIQLTDGFREILNPSIYPDSYPAFVVFDFEDADITIGKKGYLYETVPITDLDVTSITTKGEKFSTVEF